MRNYRVFCGLFLLLVTCRANHHKSKRQILFPERLPSNIPSFQQSGPNTPQITTGIGGLVSVQTGGGFSNSAQSQNVQLQNAQISSGCNCVHHATCAGAMDRIQSGCTLSDNSAGVCCPSSIVPTSVNVPGSGTVLRNSFGSGTMPTLHGNEVNAACDKGLERLHSLNNLENQLVSAKLIVKRQTPESGHLRFFRVTDSALRQHEQALTVAVASRQMTGRNFASNSGDALRGQSVRDSKLSSFCPGNPQCNRNSKYRSIDGTCNNLRQTSWGRSESPLQRIVNPRYRDGIMSPRLNSVTGALLRSPREISSTVLIDINRPDPQFTLSVMQWGQFLDHDLSHVPFPRINGEGIECCDQNGEVLNPPPHEMCMPISLPRNDGFFSTRRRYCMNFVRSMFSMGSDCLFGYAEQMNQITHWIDGSNIYGSNAEEANRLRVRRDGLLRVSGDNLLPIDPVSGGECEARDRNSFCYHAGDSRVNEQPALTAIHTIWHREHNRVASQLKSINPFWNDEQLYQEARRIVVAEWQHITYNEWLPIILGENYLAAYKIGVGVLDYSFDYNPNINPNINNEFAAAAFRFGHTLVQGIMKTGARSTIQLRDHFNSPHIFQQNPGILDQFASTLVSQPVQSFDSFITEDLTNHLFQVPRFSFGMDLMSLNIHRGRDHAIGTYNDLRETCGLRRATRFEDFLDQIPQVTLQRIQSVYQHVDDVDLWVGGISERSVNDGLLGYTFTCIVGDQFVRAKKGDRFFYDLGGQPGSFKREQLQELKRTSWARVLCDNSRIGRVQPLAFRLPNAFNQQVDCNGPSIQRVDLGFWRNEQTGA